MNKICVVMENGKPEHAFEVKEQAVSYALGGKFSEEQLHKLDTEGYLTDFNGKEIFICDFE